MSEPWTADGFTVRIPIDEDGTLYPFRVPSEDVARLIAAAPDLKASLEEVTMWLEDSDVFQTNHGAHVAAVEARKLLERI